MSNPADVLTDEFIERVAQTIAGRELLTDRSQGQMGTLMNIVRNVLREEREPVHTLIYEVRAPTREQAIEKFRSRAARNCLFSSTDIRLLDEPQ